MADKNGLTPTHAAARLGAEVMALFTPADERETGFEHIHLHGFIDAYEAVRIAGMDPHEFVEAMLRESPGEKLINDAQLVLQKAAAERAKRA